MSNSEKSASTEILNNLKNLLEGLKQCVEVCQKHYSQVCEMVGKNPEPYSTNLEQHLRISWDALQFFHNKVAQVEEQIKNFSM